MKCIKTRFLHKFSRQSWVKVVALLLAVIIAVLFVPNSNATAQVIDRNKPGRSILSPEDTPEHLRSSEVQATWSPDITITLDGKKLELLNANGAEVAPLILNGTTMLPVRALSYAFGRYIELGMDAGYFMYSGRAYLGVDEILIYTKEKAAMYAEAGADVSTDAPHKTQAIQNKTPKKITALSDPAAYVIDYDNDYQRIIGLRDANGNRVYPLLFEGTYYIPIRATAALFGCNVAWDGPNRTVVLTTTPEPPLFGEKEYVSIRYPTKDEKNTFDNVAKNYDQSEFLAWLYANTPAIVKYTTNFFGGWLDNANPQTYSNTDFVPYGESYSKAYGVYVDFEHEPAYESEPIEELAKVLIGKNDRETAHNVFSSALGMLHYDMSATSTLRDIAKLNGNSPYPQACGSGSQLVVAMMKAAGIPAIYIGGFGPSSKTVGHAWAACYLKDEERWIFIDWTLESEKGFDFDMLRQYPVITGLDGSGQLMYADRNYQALGVEIPGINVSHPLEVSYYLNNVE
jgi:hypothetical protein